MLKKLAALGPILLLTCGHGAVDSYVGLLAALTPGVAELLSIPIGHVVMLVGVTGLISNLSQPFAGWIMQKRNLAGILWLAVLVSALPLLIGYAPNFWWLCILVILGSLGTGFYHPEGVLSAHDATGEKAYLGIPLFMAGGVAICSIMIPLSIWISEKWGFKALVWLIIPGLLVALNLLLSYKKQRKTHPSIVLRPRSKRMTKVMPGHISYWPLFAVGMCFCICAGLLNAIVTSHYELRFGESTRHEAGFVLMIIGVCTSAASFAWSWWSKKKSFYLLATISQIIAVPLFILMATLPSARWGIVIAFPLALVSPAALHPVGVMLARNAAGLSQSMRTSLMVGGTYGTAAIAVMAAGVLLDKGVESKWIVMFCALCSFCAALIAAWQVLKHGTKAVQ